VGWPGADVLLPLAVIAHLWPDTDRRHVVLTPLRVFLSACLGLGPVWTTRDAACSLFAITVAYRLHAAARRFVPESFVALERTLAFLVDQPTAATDSASPVGQLTPWPVCVWVLNVQVILLFFLGAHSGHARLCVVVGAARPGRAPACSVPVCGHPVRPLPIARTYPHLSLMLVLGPLCAVVNVCLYACVCLSVCVSAGVLVSVCMSWARGLGGRCWWWRCGCWCGVYGCMRRMWPSRWSSAPSPPCSRVPRPSCAAGPPPSRSACASL
jgi:hypothetical protein